MSGSYTTSTTFTATVAGVYEITAYGASGGTGPDAQIVFGYGGGAGGLGAQIVGDFTLVAGEVLNIVVGAEGASAAHGHGFGAYYSGAGGGASSVEEIFDGTNAVHHALVIAGGGGGGGYGGTYGSSAAQGGNGQAGTAGDSGRHGLQSRIYGYGSFFVPGGSGGSFGGGGGNGGRQYAADEGGSGGGGFSTGGSGGQGGYGIGGPFRFYSGGGGGGGGYSGGGGGGAGDGYAGGGGGGGSLDTGTNQVLISGQNHGAGLVKIVPVCYLRGTHILTATGEKLVETLQPGDLLVTRFGGLQPVKWIGRQSFDGRFASADREHMPVCIRAGALGQNLPARDLYVSGGHSMLIDGQLLLARTLVNGLTITQDWAPSEIQYFHIELAGHDCVIAEGTFSESFADGPMAREKLHNAAEFEALFPDQAPATEQVLCAPRP